MKPGDIIEGPLPYVVCATINDLDRYVTIPKFIVDGLTKASGLTPSWPAGVFVIFTEEGVTLCVYGKGKDQELEFRRNTITLSNDENPTVGVAILELWKTLQGVPEDTLSSNLNQLIAWTTT